MRTKKSSPQESKQIFRPELEDCLECQTRLRRWSTISQRTILTLKGVVRLLHCGYRCPDPTCAGHQRLYRSTQADSLALPGFTFGLDVVLWVGQLRLAEHQTVDEIHHRLQQRLAPLQQTISRREILFLFEAYTALLWAATEVSHDQEWRDVVELNGGLLLSIDGIQPDKGNETIYLVRDLLTGRLLAAENVTSSTKDTLKGVLAAVVTLELPILGVISPTRPSCRGDTTQDEKGLLQTLQVGIYTDFSEEMRNEITASSQRKQQRLVERSGKRSGGECED